MEVWGAVAFDGTAQVSTHLSAQALGPVCMLPTPFPQPMAVSVSAPAWSASPASTLHPLGTECCRLQGILLSVYPPYTPITWDTSLFCLQGPRASTSCKGCGLYRQQPRPIGHHPPGSLSHQAPLKRMCP